MRKHNLRGAGTVFRYTVQQHYKTTSVVVFLVILFVLAIAAFPLMKLVTGSSSEVTETRITTLYLSNQSGIPITVDPAEVKKDSRYAALEITESDADKEGMREIVTKNKTAAGAVIGQDPLTGGFQIIGYYGEEGDVTADDMATLNGILKDALHEALLDSLGISAAQETVIDMKALSQVQTVSEYISGTDTTDIDTHVTVNIFYSYSILLLSALAMSYIFGLCMEEKINKLVETLLVSVSPMALLVGKILAATLFIFAGVGLVAVGLCISYRIAGSVAALDAVQTALGLDVTKLHFSAGSIVLVIVSVLVAYLIAAAFSGIVGSLCSKAEDMQHASLAVVLFLMIGYFTASFTPMFQNDALNVFVSVFPLTSMYVALPDYICGKIGLPVFFIGLVLQLVAAYFLAKLAGEVYRMMLFYRGGVPKPKQLFAMLKETRAAEKAAGKEADHEA